MQHRIPVVLLGLLCWSLGLFRPLAAQNRLADYTFGGSGQEICAGIVPASDGGFIVGGSTISGVSGEVTLAPRAVGSPASMDIWLFKMDAQGTKLWEKRYGGSGDDRLITILPAASGGYLLCGWTNSPQGFDVTAPVRGPINYWVVRVDVQGNKLWDKRYGSLSGEMLSVAIATADGGYLLTGTSGGPNSAPSGDRTQAIKGPSDVWTIKIDALGNKQWDSTLGGFDGESVYGAANLPGGGYALLALTSGLPTGDVTGPGNGGTDLWLIKLDAAGNKTGDRLYGGSGYDEPHTLLGTADGGLLLAGYSGSPSSGDISQGGPGIWLLKLDATGNKQWEKTYNTLLASMDRVLTMQELTTGNYILGGRRPAGFAPNVYTPGEFVLTSLTSNGTELGTKLLGGDGNEMLNSLVTMPDGTMWVAGTSDSNTSRDKTSNSRGVADIWVLKLGASVLSTTSQLPGVAVSLYPNPASTPWVSLKLDGLHDQPAVVVEISNVLGQTLYTAQAAVRHGSLQQELEVATLPAGLYTLRVRAVEGTVTRQLLKSY